MDHAPRASTGTDGDPGLFSALAATTMDAIRGMKLGADTPLLAPGGTVFLWSPINTSGPDFMKAVFAANPQLRQMSDAVTLHGYTAYPPSVEPEHASPQTLPVGQFGPVPVNVPLPMPNVQLGAKVTEMRATFAAGGAAPSKPVWLTEIGWPNKNGVDEGKQARWLVRSIVLAALNDVDLLYIYNMYDAQNNSDSRETVFLPEDYFGLTQRGGKPKQAYNAIKFFMQKLGGYRVQSRLPAHDPKNSVYIVQLTDDHGHQAWVVWDSIEAGTGFKWKLPANASCTGFLGGACAVDHDMIAVNSTPVYVMAR